MIKADDDHGNTDTVTVVIQTEVPVAAPTAAPTAKPTAAPTAKPTAKPTAVPTVKPTAAPTAAPTPEDPGFEAVFANFFASQKPLLKMLRNCRTVSSGVFSGEKEEEVVKAKAKLKKQKI